MLFFALKSAGIPSYFWMGKIHIFLGGKTNGFFRWENLHFFGGGGGVERSIFCRGKPCYAVGVGCIYIQMM